MIGTIKKDDWGGNSGYVETGIVAFAIYAVKSGSNFGQIYLDNALSFPEG